MKVHWPDFNNGTWSYDKVISFGPSWDLVHCYREDDNTHEMGLFHKRCLPPPDEFAQGTPGIMLGAANLSGKCDKCEVRVPVRYRKTAKFMFPDTYLEEIANKGDFK